MNITCQSHASHMLVATHNYMYILVMYMCMKLELHILINMLVA